MPRHRTTNVPRRGLPSRVHATRRIMQGRQSGRPRHRRDRRNVTPRTRVRRRRPRRRRHRRARPQHRSISAIGRISNVNSRRRRRRNRQGACLYEGRMGTGRAVRVISVRTQRQGRHHQSGLRRRLLPMTRPGRIINGTRSVRRNRPSHRRGGLTRRIHYQYLHESITHRRPRNHGRARKGGGCQRGNRSPRTECQAFICFPFVERIGRTFTR